MAKEEHPPVMARDIMEVLAEWPQIARTERGAMVRTSCVFPSGSLLTVSVQPAIDGWIVSDEGAAAWEAEAGGHNVEDAMRGLKSRLTRQGLRVENGKIYSERVSASELPFMVAYLATATLDAARWLSGRARRSPKHDLTHELRQFLRQEFPDFLLTEPLSLLGSTEKSYTFSNVLRLPNRQRLILDPVVRQDSSIKSRVVANIDVEKAKHANVIQRLVYDDDEDWTQPELALLAVAAPTVPFSQVGGVIRNLAA